MSLLNLTNPPQIQNSQLWRIIGVSRYIITDSLLYGITYDYIVQAVKLYNDDEVQTLICMPRTLHHDKELCNATYNRVVTDCH